MTKEKDRYRAPAPLSPARLASIPAGTADKGPTQRTSSCNPYSGRRGLRGGVRGLVRRDEGRLLPGAGAVRFGDAGIYGRCLKDVGAVRGDAHNGHRKCRSATKASPKLTAFGPPSRRAARTWPSWCG